MRIDGFSKSKILIYSGDKFVKNLLEKEWEKKVEKKENSEQ